MIVYRSEIYCDGCRRQQDGCGLSDPFNLPESAAILEDTVHALGWVKDGQAHFCPNCQRERNQEHDRPTPFSETLRR